MSDSLQYHGQQHTRLPCSSLFVQTHVHWISNAIQWSHPLSPPFPPVLNLSQCQGLSQWVSTLHQVTKVLELQHQSFQRIFTIEFLQDWLVWFPCSPGDSQESLQHHNLKASIHQFFRTSLWSSSPIVQLPCRFKTQRMQSCQHISWGIILRTE